MICDDLNLVLSPEYLCLNSTAYVYVGKSYRSLRTQMTTNENHYSLDPKQQQKQLKGSMRPVWSAICTATISGMGESFFDSNNQRIVWKCTNIGKLSVPFLSVCLPCVAPTHKGHILPPSTVISAGLTDTLPAAFISSRLAVWLNITGSVCLMPEFCWKDFCIKTPRGNTAFSPPTVC